MNKIGKFYPAKNDEQLQSILKETGSDYMTGKIIEQSEKETKVVVINPKGNNVVRIIKPGNKLPSFTEV